MIVIEIEGIGDCPYYVHVDNGWPKHQADAEYEIYDGRSNFCFTPRKLQLLFNKDFFLGEGWLQHRSVAWYVDNVFSGYNEVTVRYKKKKNA